MGTIAYSVNGEGRGHATRVHSIVEMLTPQHRFLLLASGDAFDHLEEEYRDHPFVRLERLPGLRFRYHRGKLDYLRSLASAGPFLWSLGDNVLKVIALLQEQKPDLAITDFEPLLPRAAVRCGIPWLSLDHQQFLSISDFSELPYTLRMKSWFLRSSVGLFYRDPIGKAVSSFAHLPSRKGCENVERIGVLVRKKIQELRPMARNDGGVVVYVRHHAPKVFWDVLAQLNRPVTIFGKCVPPSHGNFEYFGIDNASFMEHLCTCDALFTTAGNQLVGEAFFLGKPVMAIPERGNFEQQVNAWLVARSGYGWGVEFDQVTLHLVEQFLLTLPVLRENLKSFTGVGNTQAIDFIEQHLPSDLPDLFDYESTVRSVA